jgi:hypothetical protein
MLGSNLLFFDGNEKTYLNRVHRRPSCTLTERAKIETRGSKPLIQLDLGFKLRVHIMMKSLLEELYAMIGGDFNRYAFKVRFSEYSNLCLINI